MKRILMGGALALALTGCKTYVEADLYTTDIFAAANGESFPVRMKLGLQLASEEDCVTHKAAIAEAYATRFAEVEAGECAQIDLDTVLNLNVTTTLYPADGAIPTPEEPIALTAMNMPADEVGETGRTVVAVLFTANPEASRAVWDALPDDLTEFQPFSVEPVLTARVDNDRAEAVELYIDTVFADGKPIPSPTAVDLARRDSVELRLSDVANAALGEGVAVPVAALLAD